MDEEKVLDTSIDTTEDTETSEEVKEEPKEEVPGELGGISEEVAREIMAEAKAESDDTEEANPEQPEEKETETKDHEDSAVTASDNKEGLERPKDKVPYIRLKQEIDKKKEIESQLEAYKAKFGDINAPKQPVQPAPQQAQPVQQVQPQQMPQQSFKFTPEVMTAINQEIEKQALSMTGLSKEDLDSMEFAGEDDPRMQAYKMAKTMAQTKVMTDIQTAARRQREDAAKLMNMHNASVKRYNDFYAEQAKEPDFENVKAYITGEYFNSLPEEAKAVYTSAYSRIERNIASPSEIMLIQQFYTEGKNAYRSMNAEKATPKTTNRVKQAASYPRSSQIEGAAGVDEGKITEETLTKMMNDTPWEKIPQKYKDIMLGLNG